MKILLHNRPQIHGEGNSVLSAQVSGDFAEFRQIWWDFPESRPFTAEPADGGAANSRNFQDSVEIFLHDRPQIHGVRNSALPAQVRGGFAGFRQIWRNPPESRPFTAEPAGWPVREPPQLFRIP